MWLLSLAYNNLKTRSQTTLQHFKLEHLCSESSRVTLERLPRTRARLLDLFPWQRAMCMHAVKKSSCFAEKREEPQQVSAGEASLPEPPSILSQRLER